jgi:hypothetical protein
MLLIYRNVTRKLAFRRIGLRPTLNVVVTSQ